MQDPWSSVNVRRSLFDGVCDKGLEAGIVAGQQPVEALLIALTFATHSLCPVLGLAEVVGCAGHDVSSVSDAGCELRRV